MNIKISALHENFSDSSVMSIHPEILNEYLNLLVRLKIAANNDKKNDNQVKVRANNLIELIRKEYHLE